MRRRFQVRSVIGMTTTAQLDNAALAQQHLEYGLNEDDEATKEIWRRFPYLHGWYLAARKVSRDYLDRWEEETGEEWGPMDGPMPSLPEYAALMQAYKELVRGIAAGGPGPGIDA